MQHPRCSLRYTFWTRWASNYDRIPPWDSHHLQHLFILPGTTDTAPFRGISVSIGRAFTEVARIGDIMGSYQSNILVAMGSDVAIDDDYEAPGTHLEMLSYDNKPQRFYTKKRANDPVFNERTGLPTSCIIGTEIPNHHPFYILG